MHIAVIRIEQEPEYFDDYKRIIKELLFNGASRDLKNQNGQTALDLIDDLDAESLD